MSDTVEPKRRRRPSQVRRMDRRANAGRQLQALVEVSRAIGTIVEPKALMRTIVRKVTRVFDADRSSLYVHDRENGRLWTEVAEGLEHWPTRFSVAGDQGVCGHVFQTGRSVCIADTLADPRFARSVAEKTGYHPRSMLVVPVHHRPDRRDGVLQVMDRRVGRFSKDDLPLLEAVAVQVAVSLENVRLHAAQKRQFDSFIRAFSAALDARDSMTALHSVNVANYAMGIAQMLGLPADDVEFLRIAGLLHDIGKIGVREYILTKPGKLTKEEFEEMRRHAAATRDILSKIEFTDALADLDFLAAAHHEKLDGSGYPDGLTADRLPLKARILVVADIYDALTQKRHYRDSMSTPEALAIIDAMTPGKLDPDCVQALEWFLGRSPGGVKRAGTV